MSKDEFYRLHGYIEFLPIEVGFLTPIFSKSEQLYIPVGTNNIISNFISIPSSYLQLLHVDLKNTNYLAKEGSRCCFAFKCFDNVFYGNSDMLVEKLKGLLRLNQFSYFTNVVVEKFIQRYDQTRPQKISIMIVDDHRLVRDAWKLVLGQKENYEIIGEAESGQIAIDMATIRKPQIILMDINMEPISGIEATEKINKLCPESIVIGISVHTDIPYIEVMLKKGARGYVTKNSSKEEMFSAIDEVLKGNIYLCTEIREGINDQLYHS